MKAEVRRRVFVVSVGVIVLTAIVYGFLPKPIPVDIARAVRGPFQVTVEEEGRTRVKDRFVISAPVPGYLKRIDLEAGDLVTKGQIVAMLEPLRSTVLDPRSRAEAEAAVAAARAALDAATEKARAAEADDVYAKQKLERARKLYEDKYVAKDALDQAESEAKRAEAMKLSSEAARDAAKADLKRAQSTLRYSAAEHGGSSEKTVIIRSPARGKVLKLNRESEGVVNAGDPLLDIGNPRDLEVRVEVLSGDAVKIGKGTPVLFQRWGGEGKLEGRVRVVEPGGYTKVSSLGVEEQRVLVIVDFISPVSLWERLGDGYRLDTTFIIWEGRDVLQVPASALFRRGEGWTLFTVENKRARLHDVEVGRRNGLAAQILSGIQDGAVVVTNPDDALKDGVRLKIR